MKGFIVGQFCCSQAVNMTRSTVEQILSQVVLKKSVPRGAKISEVTGFLQASIEKGRFVPGQRLVEADLTQELNISRSLLREAFRELAARDVIELMPNRGAIIRRLSAQEALELFEIRAELEALAAGLAAGRMQETDVRSTFESEIVQIWNDRNFFSREDYIAENEAFHSAILKASGNRQLTKMYERMQLSLIMAQINSALTPEVIQTSVSEHRIIASAILQGNRPLARDAARDHLKRAADFMSQVPAGLFR